jgi:hypothetical protein
MFSEFLSCGKRWCKSNVEATEAKFTRVEGVVSWLPWLHLYRSHYAHIRHFLRRDVWCKPQLKHIFCSCSEITWLFPFLNFMILLRTEHPHVTEGMYSRKCVYIIQFLIMNSVFPLTVIFKWRCVTTEKFFQSTIVIETQYINFTSNSIPIRTPLGVMFAL